MNPLKGPVKPQTPTLSHLSPEPSTSDAVFSISTSASYRVSNYYYSSSSYYYYSCYYHYYYYY